MTTRIFGRVEDGVEIIFFAEIPVMGLNIAPDIPDKGIWPGYGTIHVGIEINCDVIIRVDEGQILHMFKPMLTPGLGWGRAGWGDEQGSKGQEEGGAG